MFVCVCMRMHECVCVYIFTKLSMVQDNRFALGKDRIRSH